MEGRALLCSRTLLLAVIIRLCNGRAVSDALSEIAQRNLLEEDLHLAPLSHSTARCIVNIEEAAGNRRFWTLVQRVPVQKETVFSKEDGSSRLWGDCLTLHIDKESQDSLYLNIVDHVAGVGNLRLQ